LEFNIKWRPVEGYEGYYEISSTGHCRSLDRVVQVGNGTRRVKGVLLKPYLNNRGYYVYGLRKAVVHDYYEKVMGGYYGME